MYLVKTGLQALLWLLSFAVQEKVQSQMLFTMCILPGLMGDLLSKE